MPLQPNPPEWGVSRTPGESPRSIPFTMGGAAPGGMMDILSGLLHIG